MAETLLLDQLTLAPPAAAGLHRVAMADANDLLACWRHYLGPCHRPLGQQGWVLHVAGRPLAVTVNASTVSAQIIRHERDSKIGKLVPTRSWRARQLVELALCANQRWATQVILRLGAPDQQGRRQHRDPTPGLPTHGDEP